MKGTQMKAFQPRRAKYIDDHFWYLYLLTCGDSNIDPCLPPIGPAIALYDRTQALLVSQPDACGPAIMAILPQRRFAADHCRPAEAKRAAHP